MLMKKEKTLLEKFIKSFFRDEDSLPYSYISQYGQSRLYEDDLRHLNIEISHLLKKYIKIRFRHLEIPKTNEIKRRKGTICVVKSILDEYIWLYRMLSTFRKIFYVCDFTKFHKKVNDKINLIIKSRSDDVVKELSDIIFENDLRDENTISFTKTDDLFDCHCSSTFDYIFLTFELLKTIEVGDEIISLVEKEFVNSWVENAVNHFEDIQSLDLRINTLRKNILLEDHIYIIEKEIITKIFSKISLNYLLTCLGYKMNIPSLEYYFELIDGKEKYFEIIEMYIDVRYKNENKKCINLENIRENKREMEKTFVGKELANKLDKILNNKSLEESILKSNDQQNFVKLFSFWLETLTWKSSETKLNWKSSETTLNCKSSETLAGEKFNSGFEKFINKDEINVIKIITETLDHILTNKTKVIDYFNGVFYRELSNLDTPLYDVSLFNDQTVLSSFVCPNLLSPVEIVFEDFSIDSNGLEEIEFMSFLKRSLYRFVGDVFNIIKDKDTFESHLREKLSLRLFNESSSIQDEEVFISCLKLNINRTVYSKLETIINDFKERTIFLNSEIMLLRRFQWPDFKSLSVNFEDLDKLKKEYAENLLKNERKTIKWLDSLSSCDIEIDKRSFRMSLIQYKMILNLCETGSVFNQNITKEEQSVYQIHLNELLKKNVLVKTGDLYEINYDAPESDCVPRQVFLRGVSDDQNVEDSRKFKDALLDCQIMRVCKERKNIKKEDLRSILGCEMSQLNFRIEECRKKGYLDVVGNLITYIP